MLTELAYDVAVGNSGIDPPRPMTADEKSTRLAIVHRAVAAVEALPDPNEHRPSLAIALGQLGAFDEAVRVARRIDQKKIQQPGQVDATWALWRISLSQAKAGNHDAARATLRLATRLETPPAADANEVRARLANGFVVAGGLDEALKMAETLDPSGRAAILSQVARHKQRDGAPGWAKILFHRALEDADRFLNSAPPPAPEVPGPVIAEGEGGPDNRGATDPKVKHRTEALALISLIHARAGDWTAAASTFASMTPENPQQRVTAFLIASRRASAGDVAGALAWARSLPSPSLRAWALRGLAVGIFGEEEGME
jgi:hypothetical protein